MGVTMHWVTKDWIIKNIGLTYHLFRESHTGINIKDAFMAILEKFGLGNRVLYYYDLLYFHVNLLFYIFS